MKTYEVFSKEYLCPLYSELGKLHCLVDDCIYTQQTAGTSQIGYNAFYDQLLAQNSGLGSSRSSRTDKVSLTHGKLDTERKMLKMVARKSSLAASETQKKGCSKPVQSSGSSDGPAAKVSAKSRHNKRQRELYKKRQKARKAQLAKLV